MVKPNSQNRFNSEQYARLKAEAVAPYSGLRKFIYIACGGSGLVGAFVFFFQVLAGRDIENALPNLALQLGVVAIVIILWRWEQGKNQR